MSSTIYELHGQVAVITMNNPPVNGLGSISAHIVEGLARRSRCKVRACADRKFRAFPAGGYPGVRLAQGDCRTNLNT